MGAESNTPQEELIYTDDETSRSVQKSEKHRMNKRKNNTSNIKQPFIITLSNGKSEIPIENESNKRHENLLQQKLNKKHQK